MISLVPKGLDALLRNPCDLPPSLKRFATTRIRERSLA